MDCDNGFTGGHISARRKSMDIRLSDGDFMKEKFYYLYSVFAIWFMNYLKQAKEALYILRYSIYNGFPNGDEEYERILTEAGFRIY